MLHSLLIGGSADLKSVAEGVRLIQAPESSDAVAIQQALILVGGSLSNSGIDGMFGDENGRAVSAFKKSRNLSPSDPVVGAGTTKRLDLEVAYLEEEAFNEPPILASSAFYG
jgi:peptidoglycan hydrolase-like protein with peptidoglycan-binding domain